MANETIISVVGACPKCGGRDFIRNKLRVECISCHTLSEYKNLYIFAEPKKGDKTN